MLPSSVQHGAMLEAFLRFLEKYSIEGTCGSACARYMPATPLKEYLRRNIDDILRAVSIPQELALYFAHDIVESYSQVFAILVSINKGHYIYDFVKQDELSDRRLPFEHNKGFPRRDDFFEEFDLKQWHFCAPTLKYHSHRKFGEKCILPFQRAGSPIFGNSGSVYKISVRSEYDLLCPLSMSGQSSVRILKEFKDESEFWAEHTAFTTLIKDGRSPEHIIEYLGSYEQGDVRCIILEFADRGSLDEYFNGTIAPKSEEDIIRFYTSLFKLLRGLMSIHEVGEDIVGWHQDVKPANILVLSSPSGSDYGCVFKMSDLVTSHFKSKEYSSDTAKCESVSFARTYNPPECWRNEDTFLQSRNIQVTQTVDIWSLGCVFVEAMVWVTFGQTGLDNFREERRLITKEIPGFNDGNCFHDGWSRLQLVDDWLDRVVDEGRKFSRDNISPGLAYLVRQMLDGDPSRRPDTKSIYHWTKQNLATAVKKLQQRSGSDTSQNRPQPPPCTPPRPPTRPYGGESSQSQGHSAGRSSVSTFGLPSSPPSSPFTVSEGEHPSHIETKMKSSPPNGQTPVYMGQGSSPSGDAITRHSARLLSSSPSPVGGSPTSNHVGLGLQTVLENGPSTLNGPPTRTEFTAHRDEVPVWAIQDAFRWRDQRRAQRSSTNTMKHFLKPDRDKFADIEGSNDLQELSSRDHILVIDDSYSMRNHKNEVARMVDLFAYSLKGFDEDGVELYLSVAKKNFKEKNSKRLVDRFHTNSSFRDHCNMAHCLRQIFKDYKDKVKRHSRGFPLTPMNIYVLTDAVWQPKCEVKTEIIAFVNFLAEWKVDLRQVGIQFIRFGTDVGAMQRLRELDRLKQKGEAVRDIVDEEHWTGNFFKMLLGSINPLFDDDDDDDDDETNGQSEKSHNS